MAVTTQNRNINQERAGCSPRSAGLLHTQKGHPKMNIHRIINLLTLLILLNLCTPVHAGWFGWGEADRLRREREEEQRHRLNEAERQLGTQRKAAESWQFTAGSVAVGGVVLLIIGTALGARTRHAARTTS